MPFDRSAAAAVAADLPPIRVATYNIHTCVGLDGRYDPGRIGAVLREIDADIVCLQEVDARCRHLGAHADQWAYFAEMTGREIVRGHSRGRFGNAVLSRFPVLAERAIDLSVGGYEPRSAIDADFLVGGQVLRVIATHFGLHAWERRLQASRLLAALGDSARHGAPVLLMGDLNEWRGRTGGVRALESRLDPGETPRTFPSWLPVLPLDRILVCGPASVRDVSVYRSRLARVASDHLPLVGDLCWGPREPERRRERRNRRRERTAEAVARIGRAV